MRKLLVLLFLSVAANAATVSVNSPTPANTVLVGPTTGADANPTFRLLSTNDFPSNVINGASLVNTSVNLTTKVTSQLPIPNGGTAGATKQAGFDNLSPTAAKGDLVVFNGTNNVAQNVGTNNFVLVADSTTATGVKWAAAGTGTAFSGLTGGTNTAAAMLIGTGASFGPTGSGTVTANQFVGTGSTTNAVDLATAEVAGILTNNKGGSGADTSATGGAHFHVFQTSVGGAFTVALDGEADLPATTAFTDTANIFGSAQTINNYFCLLNSSPAQITGDQIAFNPGAESFVRITTDASHNIQGIGSGTDGRILDIVNVGASPAVIQHQNAGALAANRIISPSGGDITLSPNYGAELIYDGTTLRWRILNFYQTGGGAITIPSGTSGGIPYYSGSSTITGSGALTLNAIVVGGGAGGAPSTPVGLGTTTQVAHGNAGGAFTWGSIVNADITANTIDMSTKMTGTMQAAQVPTFTGDVTTPGGSLTTTIANLAVTNAKIAAGTIDLTTKVLVGNALPIATGGTGAITQQAAIDALAGSAAKGAVLVYNGTHWVQLPAGADNSVLTALAASTNGVQWGAAGGVTVAAPIATQAGAVSLGTSIAPTVSDANTDVAVGASTTTKVPLMIQTKSTNTVPAIEVESSAGPSVVQWSIDNSTNSQKDITEKLGTPNLANIQMQSISENVTIAASATSTSATNLLPANAYIIGVTARVTNVIPTASTFTIGVTGQPSLFAASTSTVNGTTASSMKQSPPIAPFTNASAQQILITPNLTPGAGTGTLRITVFYFTCQEPQN